VNTAQDSTLPMVALKLGEFDAPQNEEALYKGIPIALRDNYWVAKFIRENSLRARYRGPRRTCPVTGKVTHLGKQDCLRADATSFSLYKRV
jgi:hypothetical protein